MRFVVFKGEKSVADLVKRLFHHSGGSRQAAAKTATKQTAKQAAVQQPAATQAETQQATAVLLKANPQLKDVSKVPVGSLIAIPDTAPPLQPNEQVIVPGVANSFAVEQVQSALNSLYQRLDEIDTTGAAKVKSGMDGLQTAEMKTALKTVATQNLTLVNRLPSIDSVAADSKQVTKDLQTAQKSRKQALTQMQAALASFAKK
jgi:hypothetical protein